MVAQAAHIPVHLGSTPASVRAALDAIQRWRPGDGVLLNDPYAGGTHLPDITLVSPVFAAGNDERPAFFVVNRAHHADVGGAEAGSMAPASEIFAEGLRIPPVRFFRAGEPDPDLAGFLLANVRTPRERRADLHAQWAANRLAERRLLELLDTYGRPTVDAHVEASIAYARRLTASVISQLPARRSFRFEDVLDDDGLGATPGPTLRVCVRRDGERLRVDFRDSDDQVRGSLNANRAITLSCVFYVLRLLAPDHTPSNEGVLELVDVVTRQGSIVDALPPAATAGGNVETSQRIVDVLLGALAPVWPDRIPAASCGTMTNLTFGGRDEEGRAFTYYETIPGGMGARPGRDGISCVQTHMTNTRSTPIEALELEFPVLVESFAMRRGSGGRGEHRGGDGAVRRLRFRVPVRVSLLAERFAHRPYGLSGGEAGRPAKAFVLTEKGRRARPGKGITALRAGEGIEVHTRGEADGARRTELDHPGRVHRMRLVHATRHVPGARAAAGLRRGRAGVADAVPRRSRARRRRAGADLRTALRRWHATRSVAGVPQGGGRTASAGRDAVDPRGAARVRSRRLVRPRWDRRLGG